MLEELESAWQELAFGHPEHASASPAAMPYDTNKMAVGNGAWSA
jgi:hypothetical protein